MVASSLESVKELIKECVHGRDATRANNEALIGSGKIEHLLKGKPFKLLMWLMHSEVLIYHCIMKVQEELTGDDIIALQGTQNHKIVLGGTRESF